MAEGHNHVQSLLGMGAMVEEEESHPAKEMAPIE